MKYWMIAGLLGAAGIATAGWFVGEGSARDSEDRAFRVGRDFAPVRNARYLEECGSCHFPYQPGLLPAASWQRVMGGLDKHFGENAELDPALRTQLLTYLTDNAADRVGSGRGPHIAASLRGSAPLRITETDYFRRKHHEIPQRAVQGNPKVGGFSQCDTCHTQAKNGSYDEDTVRIPGWGRWED